MRIIAASWLPLLALQGTWAQTPANTTASNTTLGAAPSSGKGLATPNPEWARLLSSSILFYEAQRSGKLPASNRIDWRHDSALLDGNDNGLNLSGGWFDAGDYLKFTFPHSFVLTQLSWGGITFWDGYVSSGQVGYFSDQMRWGFDWLIAAHPSPSTLCVQVGDGNVDNNYWGPDTGIPSPRPSYLINAQKPGTDVAGEAAAAFAAGSILFRNSFRDTAYADTLLQHAKDAYAFADSAPYALYQNSVPQSAAFYASTAYEDEMCWGAAWLWRATNTTSYLQRATAWIAAGNLRGIRDSVDWNSKTGACFVLLAASGATDWVAEAEAYLDSIISISRPARSTRHGLLWYNDASPPDSTVPSSNAAFLLLLYAESLPTTNPKRDSYIAFATGQIDYLLGKNPEKTPYVCGIHPNSPQNPHHAGASGGTDIGNIRTSPLVSLHTLTGAMVGGPDFMDGFNDDRSNWMQNEVALDYNAPFQGWAARQAMYVQEDPVFVSLPINPPRIYRAPGTTIGIIAGTSVLFVLLIVAAIVWYRKEYGLPLFPCCGRKLRKSQM